MLQNSPSGELIPKESAGGVEVGSLPLSTCHLILLQYYKSPCFGGSVPKLVWDVRDMVRAIRVRFPTEISAGVFGFM